MTIINVGAVNTSIPLQCLPKEEWFDAMRRLIPGIETERLEEAWTEFLVYKEERLSAASPNLQ